MVVYDTSHKRWKWSQPHSESVETFLDFLRVEHRKTIHIQPDGPDHQSNHHKYLVPEPDRQFKVMTESRDDDGLDEWNEAKAITGTGPKQAVLVDSLSVAVKEERSARQYSTASALPRDLQEHNGNEVETQEAITEKMTNVAQGQGVVEEEELPAIKKEDEDFKH